MQTRDTNIMTHSIRGPTVVLLPDETYHTCILIMALILLLTHLAVVNP